MTAKHCWWVAVLTAALAPALDLRAQEGVWRPVTAAAPAATPSAPAAAVSLGKPVPVDAPDTMPADDPASPLGGLYRTAYRDGGPSPADPLPYVARGEPPDAVPPPVVGPPPPPPVEGYNNGVVTDQPLRKNWWDKCKNWFQFGDRASATGRCTFQSDAAFNCLASPVTNPFLFEDPRALTELRPIFFFQQTPHVHGGGYSGFFGTQARLALCENWSIVLNELGGVFLNPNTPPPGIHSSNTGFAQISIGPKWTFYRCPDRGTVVATGLNFQIPTGSGNVFQDTGTLSLVPYLSAAQHLHLPQGYGGLNLMGTTGYSFSIDSARSEFYYLSLHADYDIANMHRFYPFLEMNWFYYTSGGHGPALGFEGADLINFGSSSLGGRNFLTLAPGFRFKFNEHIQAGFAAEFPLTSQKELTNYRLTFDLIFRY
jgi:hypothetical protein